MVNIVNATALGGGFRHYNGLLPVTPGDGNPHARASVRYFHVAATSAVAMFRGDIVNIADADTLPVAGGADLPQNISAPSASVVIGNGGGSGLGNTAMAPNVARWAPGDTTNVIAGVVVGFGPITLYQAKNGFQYLPALTEAWAAVETDEQVEMDITMPTVPGTAFNLQLMSKGVDVQANAAQQSTRFGQSGVSLNPATIANTATLPLRILNSGWQIGNDTLAAGFVARVMFNQSRHFRGSAGFTV
jgi:hypothetical protein